MIIFLVSWIAILGIFVYAYPRSDVWWKRSDYFYFGAAIVALALGLGEFATREAERATAQARSAFMVARSSLAFEVADRRRRLRCDEDQRAAEDSRPHTLPL